MAVIVDASVIVVMASGDPRRPRAYARWQQWAAAHESIHAPSLMPYEVANGLTRLIAAGTFPAERLAAAWRTVTSLPITYHPLDEQGEAVVQIARQLGRVSAYDAAYLALAHDLDAGLWTFDGPLARNARAFGFPIHLVD